MKILNDFKIEKPMQKIVETYNGYIMNGQYYNKETMCPQPFSMFPTYGSYQDLAMNKVLSTNHALDYLNTKTENNVIIDKYDPEINYIFTSGWRNSYYGKLLKIRENNSKATLLKELEYNHNGIYTSNYRFLECIGQTEKFLFIIVEANTGYCQCIIKIDKETLVATNVLVCNHEYYASCRKIHETEDMIYIIIEGRYTYSRFYKINKFDYTNEFVDFLELKGNYNSKFIPSNCEKINDKYVFYLMNHKTDGDFYFSKMTFDPNAPEFKNSVTTTKIEATWSDELKKIPQFFATEYQCTYELSILNINSKKYLNVLMYENGLSKKHADNFKVHGIYTFEIDPNDNAKLIYRNKTDQFSFFFRGAIGFNNNINLIGLTEAAVLFFNFDATNEKYVINKTIACQPYSIGIDLKNNIWISKGNGDVDMHAPSIPTTVNINFEKNSYKFEGEEIQSNLLIECFDYDNKPIECNLELTLMGNAIFAKNDSKIINITTASTENKIPIKIIGAGNVSVYTKVNL